VFDFKYTTGNLFYKIMNTILLYTALMIGITFLIGFAVAALIKIVTDLLTLAQDHSAKEIISMWKQYFTNGLVIDHRVRVLSTSNEYRFDIFDYSCSHDSPKKSGKNKRNLPGIFDYSVSHNSGRSNPKLPEIFDYTVSHNSSSL
jgi:hypothetical protein